jgi:Alcohol dehydrogenase GroES-like domain
MLMKAIVIDGYGASDRLQPREVERPEPSAGEVLIRVRAAGVNPIDWKVRRGLLRPVLWLRFPLILGSDVAGVVEAVRPGVTRFRPGDPVVALLDPIIMEDLAPPHPARLLAGQPRPGRVRRGGQRRASAIEIIVLRKSAIGVAGGRRTRPSGFDRASLVLAPAPADSEPRRPMTTAPE